MTFTLLKELPEPIGRVLDESVIEGLSGRSFLANKSVTDVRKACLLNILAVCCVTPAQGEPLIDKIDEVFAVKDERIYVTVDSTLKPVLDTLVAGERMAFYEDAQIAAIHRTLLTSVPRWLNPLDFANATLNSYRSEGHPSLQVVLADSHLNYSIADIDLDLANPLQDVVGFFGHLWELWADRGGGVTDSLKLRATLASGTAAPFLGYTL